MERDALFKPLKDGGPIEIAEAFENVAAFSLEPN